MTSDTLVITTLSLPNQFIFNPPTTLFFLKDNSHIIPTRNVPGPAAY